MTKLSSKIHSALLFFSDILLFYVSLILALFIRFGEINYHLWQIHWPIFTGLLAFWLIIFYAFNLYESSLAYNKMELLASFAKAIIVNTILAIIYFYIIAPQTNLAPKTILVIMLAVFSLAFYFFRNWLIKIFDAETMRQNILFIGYEQLIEEILPDNSVNRRLGYNFKGIIANSPPNTGKLPRYFLSELNQVLKKDKINLVVVSEPNDKEVINLLFQALPLRINFISLTSFYEQVIQKVPLKMISRGWFLENFSEGNKEIFELLKRIFDLFLCIVLGIISLVMYPFIALAIASTSKGGIIFKQIRVGKDGKEFMALKFRTMHRNAENNGPMWAKENDPRITKIGGFLRKSRLDEIPQLLNILKGEMSFVGPRPERPEFIEQLINEIPFYKERLLVKPGLTGWAQIKMQYADSISTSLEKLQYDLYYVKHRSLLFDLGIILKTISTVLQKLGR